MYFTYILLYSLESKINLQDNMIKTTNNYFQNYSPKNLAWHQGIEETWSKYKHDNQITKELFKECYEREPMEHEDYVGLTKAGIILNFVFGMCEPPTQLSKEEYNLITQSANILAEKDPSVSFAMVMTISIIQQANQHLKPVSSNETNKESDESKENGASNENKESDKCILS